MRFFCIPLFTCKAGIVETLDYSQLRMEEIPKEVFKLKKHIEELFLNVNGIEILPPEFFRCTKLRRLDISENKIKVLPPEIRLLQSLTDLNLSKNEFVELPEEIGECRSLQLLNASTNIVPKLPKSIVNLNLLTHLNVSNNSLTQLPNDIDQLNLLQCLDVGQCELRFLPPSIVHLSNLKILDLCENYLTELPQGMGKLLSLEILDLRNNMITHLTDDILQCCSLKNLDISCNNLSELPFDIGDLVNLTELSVCDNQITSIPSSIGKLKKLEILKASKNRINDLTPAICSCVSLTDLILCENQLNELPSSLGNLKYLKFFDVNVNNLHYIPTTIGGCSSLGVLSLRHNQIKELPMEIGRLSRLQVLDLIDNNLTYLPYTLTVLYQSKSLSALWLSFNQPSLPKLSVASEPVMNVKVLTCYLLPQKCHQPIDYSTPINKSCIGGARVCFAKEFAPNTSIVETNQEDDEDKIPIGRFERYDTPHPKPFAPKNCLNRNITELQKEKEALITKNNDFQTNGALSKDVKPQTEIRPLRSVLKRRPQSILSQNALTLAAETENPQLYEKIHIRMIKKSANDVFGWHIAGGIDSAPHKGRLGIFISHVIEGSLASQFGFQADDKLISVNGTVIDSNLTHTEAVELIRNAGRDVEIVIERLKNIPSLNHPSVELNSQKFQNAENNLREIKADVSGVNSQINKTFSFAEQESLGDEKSLTTNSLHSKTSSTNSVNNLNEILAITLCRKNNCELGFTIIGDGTKENPLTIGAVLSGSIAESTGKIFAGDRLISVNGVNLKGINREQAVNLLKMNVTKEVYLIVERNSSNKINKKTFNVNNNSFNSKQNNAKQEQIINTNVQSNLNQKLIHANSLPSLIHAQDNLFTWKKDNSPLFSLQATLNNIYKKEIDQKLHQKNLITNRSMSNLTSQTIGLENNKLFLKQNNPSVSFKNPNALNSMSKDILKENALVEDKMKPIFNLEQPLATSSPIPQENNTLSISTNPSQIPILNSNYNMVSNNLSLPHLQPKVPKKPENKNLSLTKTPPPVAPKPKLVLEKLDFSSKLKRFEDEINSQKNLSNGTANKLNTTSLSNVSYRSGIPMKKPLVSTQDLEKLENEEEHRLRNQYQTNDFNNKEDDSICELSDDPCFNFLLKQESKSLALMNGPTVIRTRNAEVRAERIAKARAEQQLKHSKKFNFLNQTKNLSDNLKKDETSLSRSSSSMSTLEQRATDLEKRQAWRQARLQSMVDESKRTDDVIKLITSIPPSPIPIQ